MFEGFEEEILGKPAIGRRNLRRVYLGQDQSETSNRCQDFRQIIIEAIAAHLAPIMAFDQIVSRSVV